MVEIADKRSGNYASVMEGYLCVCLCDKTCDHHASLEDLLSKGYNMLIHVKDKDGNIVPLERV